MEKADYNWNQDADERKIADAIADLNQRLEVVIEQEQEEESEEQEQQGICWPSLMPKTED